MPKTSSFKYLAPIIIGLLGREPLRGADAQYDFMQARMFAKPMNALKGACLGGCKDGMVFAKYLPNLVLQSRLGQPQEIRKKSAVYQENEGLFSSDLIERPYAYQRLFKALKISDEDFQQFIDMANEIELPTLDLAKTAPKKGDKTKKDTKDKTKKESKEKADKKDDPDNATPKPKTNKEIYQGMGAGLVKVRKFVYPLVLKALRLPPEMISSMYAPNMEATRKSFYTAVSEFYRKNEARNLEFWSGRDKSVYNILFGEFNYAWMAVLDIFESEEFNPQQKVFKRIFPQRKEDLGVAIYSPNKKGPDESLEVDLRDEKQVPTNSIIIYRLGSNFSRGTIRTGEINWEDVQNDLGALWVEDNKPGHIECVTIGPGKDGTLRYFCSDGKKDKPATEWNVLNRQVFAVYVPQAK